jgi:hypothetical protein
MSYAFSICHVDNLRHQNGCALLIRNRELITHGLMCITAVGRHWRPVILTLARIGFGSPGPVRYSFRTLSNGPVNMWRSFTGEHLEINKRPGLDRRILWSWANPTMDLHKHGSQDLNREQNTWHYNQEPKPESFIHITPCENRHPP